MPDAPVSFGNAQASGNAELAGASPLAVNVMMDGAGAVRRRPGISAWSGFPGIAEPYPITGITSWGTDIYYVNSLRRIRRVSGGIDTALTDGTANSHLDGTGRPVFAETPWRLVIAGGGAPEMINSGATVAARLGGSPPDCDAVVAVGNRLFLVDGSTSATRGEIRFSGLGDTGSQSFDTLDFVNADARPDDIVRLHENSNEVFAFGATTLQVFSPDPVSVLAPGRTKNMGCAAAHGVIRADEMFYWLDEQKQVRSSDARSDSIISTPIAGTLDAIATVSDCYGFRVNLGQFDSMVWSFPSDGRSFAFSGGWSQWQGWTQNYGHAPLAINSLYYWAGGDTYLVGLATGQIAKLDSAAATDLGGLIKAEVMTGFLDRETDAYKHCQRLTLAFKRGQTAAGGKVLLSWRDDLGPFCSPITLDLGAYGDRNPVIDLRSLGVYRRRQWRLEMTDAVDLTLASARETFAIGV